MIHPYTLLLFCSIHYALTDYCECLITLCLVVVVVVVVQSNLGGIITSGGGFSTYFPQPSWQTAAVSNYFNEMAAASTTPVIGFNSQGRGIPDISLLGVNYQVRLTDVLFDCLIV